MKKNVGITDAIVRIITGSLIAAWGISQQNWWGALAIIPIITAFARYCPLYQLFGIRTCHTKRPGSKSGY